MAGMIELEREQHNAQIQERYRRILEAEEIQFDTPVQASAQAPALSTMEGRPRWLRFLASAYPWLLFGSAPRSSWLPSSRLS